MHHARDKSRIIETRLNWNLQLKVEKSKLSFEFYTIYAGNLSFVERYIYDYLYISKHFSFLIEQ